MANKIRANEEQYVIVGYGGKRIVDEEGKIYYPSLTARMMAATFDILFFSLPLIMIAGFIPWHFPQEGNDIINRINSGELKNPEEVNAALRHFMIQGGGLLNIFMQMVLTLSFAGIYVLPFWFKYGATPGKMIMGMKIVRQDSLEKPSKKRLLARFLCYPLSIMPPGIGYMWVIFNKRKRSWHDLISGTMVIYKKKPRFFL